jgi:hypothetical protein
MATQTVRLRALLAALLVTTAAVALVRRTERVTVLFAGNTSCDVVERLAQGQDCVAECRSEEKHSAYSMHCFGRRPIAETVARLSRAPGVKRAVLDFQRE